jgi:predicted RNA-binding Zn-ribbon protein involved in translation (DUF1610 family)
MKKRRNAIVREPFKRGERGYVVFPCPQCGQELQTPIDFPGWCECPKCQRKIFWREAKWISDRVKSGKCEACGEPVRPGGNICGDCLEQFLCGDTICEACGKVVLGGGLCPVCFPAGSNADMVLGDDDVFF